MPDGEFDLKQLCDLGGVTPRTVHFYVQQGLLPPAGAPGPGAHYGEGHVARLKLIRLLQKQHLPLAEIGKRLKTLTDAQVQRLLDETRSTPPAKGRAIDYIRDVLAGGATPPGRSEGPVARFALRESAVDVDVPRASAAPDRSQWERFTLDDGIELHVRRPLSRFGQRKLDRLLTAARQIFNDNEE